MTDRRSFLAPAFAPALLLAGALVASASSAASAASAASDQSGAPSPQGSPRASAIEMVTLPSETPLVAIRLLFDAGSIHDPAGKEGLATLTALMVSQGDTQKRSYSQLLDALYPMAASISFNTDREVTVFTGTVHRETLAEYAGLLREALLQPAFAPADLERNRELLLSSITNSLRSNDELLGLEVLQTEIFEGHPYDHPSDGTVEGLKSITLDDVKKFYREHYTQANLMLGLAGGYPEGFPGELQRAFAALPVGQKGRNFTFVEKETGSVGITLGHALPINRSHPDYYPLMVANSYLGEHRTMYGRLMNQLRGLRGLNYGDYSYIEYWYYPPGTNYPTANVPRRQQYFSIWLRPVVSGDAQFALRAALYELRRLHDQGMTKEEVETARSLLINYSKLWAQSPSERLGFLMDSRFYGMPPYLDEIEERLKKLTVDQVNAAIKKYLNPDDLDIVVVAKDARELAETLRRDAPSPKTYNSQVSEQVQAEDKTIQAVPVKPAAVEIVPIDQVFQK
jgi:zinc protease